MHAAETHRPAWFVSALASVRRVAGNSRLRGEVTWSLGHRSLDYIFVLVELKLLTNLLSKEAYGEYSLITTALLLVASVAIFPMHHSFLRYFHTAPGDGAARTAGRQMLAWFAIVTGTFFSLCAIFTLALSNAFALERWAVLAAGACFVFDRFRGLCLELLEVQRRRRAGAMQNIGCHVLFVALLLVSRATGVSTATAALTATAFSSGLLAVIGVRALWRDLLPREGRQPGNLRSLVWTFGVPYAVLLTMQWVQTFSDRYMIEIQYDAKRVAQYATVYQVCGIPYMLAYNMAHWLLVPIAYQRAKDVTDARQLRSADRVVLAGIGVYVAAGAPLIGLYWLIGEPLVAALTSKQYVLPAATLALVAAARFLSCLAPLIQNIFLVHQKTANSLVYRVIGAALALPICWWTIGRYEIWGAALGALISGGLYLLIVVVGPGGCLWLVRSTRAQAAAAGASRL